MRERRGRREEREGRQKEMTDLVEGQFQFSTRSHQKEGSF